MKIVNIIGGLGNQMFQYAFALALQNIHTGEEVLVDTQHYRSAYIKKIKGNNFYHNGFEIEDIFPNAILSIADRAKLRKLSYWIPNYIVSRFIRKVIPKRRLEFIQDIKDAYSFKPEPLFLTGDLYFEGYWMSPKYFDFCRNVILDVYTFRPFNTKENLEYQKLFESENSVTIHIRRGDYLSADNFKNICTLDYYKMAIELAKEKIEKPVFFIFSNDHEGCMKILKPVLGDSHFFFVTNNIGNESYRDMQLMSIARCNILANSSFSWWGAYLNQRSNQIVICPKKWVNHFEHNDIYINNWIKI